MGTAKEVGWRRDQERIPQARHLFRPVPAGSARPALMEPGRQAVSRQLLEKPDFHFIFNDTGNGWSNRVKASQTSQTATTASVAQTSESAVSRASKPAPARRFGNRRYGRFGNLRYESPNSLKTAKNPGNHPKCLCMNMLHARSGLSNQGQSSPIKLFFIIYHLSFIICHHSLARLPPKNLLNIFRQVCQICVGRLKLAFVRRSR